MARKKKVEPMTVTEFQSYLKGIIEFSEEGWSPNKDQWDKIYEHIIKLKPDTVGSAPVQSTTQPTQQGQQHRQVEPAQQVQPVIQESLITSVSGAPNEQYASETPAPKVDMRKSLTRPGASKVAEGGQVPSSGVTVVTPNKEADDQSSDFL